MTEAEETNVNDLLASLGVPAASLTRRDPGETGPVLVHTDSQTFEVDESGSKEIG